MRCKSEGGVSKPRLSAISSECWYFVGTSSSRAMFAGAWLLLALLRAGRAAAQTRVSTAAELLAATDAGDEVIILTDHIFFSCDPDNFFQGEQAVLQESTVAIVVRCSDRHRSLPPSLSLDGKRDRLPLQWIPYCKGWGSKRGIYLQTQAAAQPES